MKPLALRTKLTLFYTSILTLLVLSIAFAYYQTLAHELNAAATDELVERSVGLKPYLNISDTGVKFTSNEADAEQVYFVETASQFFQVYRLSNGILLAQSPRMRALGLAFTPAELKEFGGGNGINDIDTSLGKIRLHSTRIPATDSHEVYLLQVGVSMSSEEGALRQFMDTLLLVLPLSLVASAYLGWWMSGRALLPLRETARAAEEIGPGELHRRLHVRGANDELDKLAEAFNRTLGRLEDAVGEIRQFTASIAHELRTPLTVLRGEAEVALMKARSEEDYRQVLESILEEFDKLARIINQTLTLARAESGEIALARKPVDFSALVDELVVEMTSIGNAKGVNLVSDLQPQIQVMGDSAWLERMLLNLIDNGIKFTPTGGRVNVQLRRDRGTDSDSAVLIVSDTGTGISAEALPRIFDRFFRADPSRSRDVEGSGLGLTLAQWIVRQHQGTIVASSRPGEGAEFVVRLPASPSQH